MPRPPPITRPRHRPDITPPAIEALTFALAAGDRLAVPAQKPRWQIWAWRGAWGGALLLHILALAVALYSRARPMPDESESPPGISVVFDKGGTETATAPPAPRQGPPSIAQSPPPPPPPPPQQQVEENLDLPQNPLSAIPMPPPQPRPVQPQPAPPRPHPPVQHYVLVPNGYSYGNPSPVMPPPTPHMGMNFDLPQTDAQAVAGPELSVKGDIGADWDAALSKWVDAHKYYPQAALEQDQQGDVEIEFTVDRQGNVTGLRPVKGSGSIFLDQAWLGLFQGAQLPPFPPGTKADHITVDATMHYELLQ